MKYKVWIQKNNKIETLHVSDDKLPDNIIQKKKLVNGSKGSLFQKSDIIGFIYEMKIMLEANLAFKEIIEILLQSNNTKQINKILQMIKWSIENGKPIHKTLMVYKKELGYIPILFFKYAQESGDMKGAIGALFQLLKEQESIKEKLFNAIKYPMVLLLSLIVSLGVIFSYVVPKFEHLFSQFSTELPLSTQLLLSVDQYLFQYGVETTILLITLSVFVIYLYHRNRIHMDKFLFYKIPYFSSMYRQMTIYKLFLSLYFICSTKNRFHNALKNSLKISNNKYVKYGLNLIIEDINNGTNISQAFERSNLFDDSTIRLLRSGEKANSLEKVLEDIKDINKKRLEKSIDRFTSILEPLLIFILAIVILWIVLAIMTPIWQLGSLMN